MARFETVLGRRRGERGAESGKKQSFENLNLRTQQVNRSVGRALVRGFAWLENRDDVGRFPNGRDVGSPDRQVKKMSCEADAQRPKVLHVKHREAIRASSGQIFLALIASTVSESENGENERSKGLHILRFL